MLGTISDFAEGFTAVWNRSLGSLQNYRGGEYIQEGGRETVPARLLSSGLAAAQLGGQGFGGWKVAANNSGDQLILSLAFPRRYLLDFWKGSYCSTQPTPLPSLS